MKFKAIVCVLIGSIFLIANAQSIENKSITYKNSRGSILHLESFNNETITGSFLTAVATPQCPKAVGMKRPITGFVVKNAITISVSYPECGSVLTLIGNIDEQNGTIETTALLAQQTDQIYKKGNSAQIITHDTFKRI